MSNADDILKNLRDRGIDPGAWQSRPEGKLNLLLLQKQMEILGKIGDLLRSQVDVDLVKLAELQDAYARIEKAKGLGDGE